MRNLSFGTLYAKHVLSFSCSFTSCRISGPFNFISLSKKKRFWVGIVLLISAFNRRFSSGVWFHFQGKFAFTGNLIIKTDHTVSTKSRLQTKYKTADLVQNAGCISSTKRSLGPKCRLKTADWAQNAHWQQKLLFFVRNVVTFDFISYLLSRSNLTMKYPMCRTYIKL